MAVNQEPCIDGQERTGTAMFDKVEQMALKIEGMTCGHCQKRVEEALKAVKGVKGLQVSQMCIRDRNGVTRRCFGIAALYLCI